MAHILRPVIRWPRWQHSRCLRAALHDLLRSSSEIAADTPGIQRPSLAAAYSSKRDIHFRSRGLRLPNAPAPSDFRETESDDSDPDAKKSRNQKKREARRCVRWGMELASFSSPQIKRILKAASLERDVYDAIMLVKRLGRDVREGKRRQFNYIGRLLREVEPELMDGLIEATKDGDQSKFQALSGLENWVVGDDEEEVEEAYYDDEDELARIDMIIIFMWECPGKITNIGTTTHVDVDPTGGTRGNDSVHLLMPGQEFDRVKDEGGGHHP
ncbi:uncharacterized protein LOC127808310 isoform X4 [Diospyros lotus]|uniref:uncharacterized protein LOC127808310 isoform X4 n=1 Tax=Diospyros lotus TaxID=55363 RepID=UPI00224FAB26|nr:uncharacterized protein LOC127808310 isoform X4 [Diospyros lotus]